MGIPTLYIHLISKICNLWLDCMLMDSMIVCYGLLNYLEKGSRTDRQGGKNLVNKLRIQGQEAAELAWHGEQCKLAHGLFRSRDLSVLSCK